MVGEVPTSEGRDVEIPNWLRWVLLAVLIVWLINDPKGLASVVGDVWNGVMTFFKTVA
jgi:hypothetical protein